MAKADLGVNVHLMFRPNDGWRRIPIHVMEPVKYAQERGAVTVKQRRSATNETVIWTAKRGMLV